MLVQRNLYQLWRCIVDQNSTLLISSILQQFLAQIVSERI